MLKYEDIDTIRRLQRELDQAREGLKLIDASSGLNISLSSVHGSAYVDTNNTSGLVRSIRDVLVTRCADLEQRMRDMGVEPRSSDL